MGILQSQFDLAEQIEEVSPISTSAIAIIRTDRHFPQSQRHELTISRDVR